MAKGRKYDADLCRARGWEPGTILGFSPTAEDYRGSDYEHPEVLTAVGVKSILVASITHKMVRNPDEPGCHMPTDHMELGKEMAVSGQLYQKVIRKIGRWDFAKNEPIWDDKPACR